MICTVGSCGCFFLNVVLVPQDFVVMVFVLIFLVKVLTTRTHTLNLLFSTI